MTFIKHHKHHLSAFIILIIIAVVSGYFAFGTPDNNDRMQNTDNRIQTSDNTIQDKSNKIQTNTKNQNTNDTPPTTLSTTTTISTPSTTPTINYYLQITNDSQNSSTTVLDLMQERQFEHRLSFSGKEYSGMGFFVDEINGVKNDNLAGKYWIYYVNGQSAQVGISNYVLKPNDLIEWKYENAKL